MPRYTSLTDDSSSSIEYSDGWSFIEQAGPWMSTMHSTTAPGASVRIPFDGMQIAVVSALSPDLGSTSNIVFSIDGGRAQYIETFVDSSDVEYDKVIWDSGPLDPGSHLLTITNAGSSGGLILDAIEFIPNVFDNPDNGTDPIMNSATTTSDTMSSITFLGSPSTLSAMTSPTSSNNAPKLPTSSTARLLFWLIPLIIIVCASMLAGIWAFVRWQQKRKTMKIIPLKDFAPDHGENPMIDSDIEKGEWSEYPVLLISRKSLPLSIPPLKPLAPSYNYVTPISREQSPNPPISVPRTLRPLPCPVFKANHRPPSIH